LSKGKSPRRPGLPISVSGFRDSFLEGQQDLHKSLDSKVEALKEAVERSMQLVNTAPSLASIGQETPGGRVGRSPSNTDITIRSASSCDNSTAGIVFEDNGSRPPRPDEPHRMIALLQRHVEDQQQQQRAKIAMLSEKWEERFVALEKALNSGLETATVATTSMNERLAKFMGLAEVLEGAVQRVVQSDRDIASLSRRTARLEDSLARKVAEIEGDVAGLAQELATDRAERPSADPAAGGESDAAKPRSGDGEGRQLSARNDVDRLARQLTDERAERLQLALEVQGTRCDLERMHALLDTTTDHLSSLSRELCTSGGEGLSAERRDNWGMQLDALRREIRREAAGRAASLAAGTSSRRHRRSPGALKIRSGSSRIERIEEEEEEEQQQQQQQVPEVLDGDTGSAASQRPSFGPQMAAVPRGWGSGGSNSEGR